MTIDKRKFRHQEKERERGGGRGVSVEWSGVTNGLRHRHKGHSQIKKKTQRHTLWYIYKYAYMYIHRLRYIYLNI